TSLVIIPKAGAEAGKDAAKSDTKAETKSASKTDAKDAPPTVRLKLPQTAAYRPSFKNADGKDEEAGTAFVVQAASGKKVALTAAHIMEPKEWASLKGVSLLTMSGEKVVDLPVKPTYLGKGFDQLPPLR